MSASGPPRRVGRPRNEDTAGAVMEVVRQLVGERGFEAVTVNMVAMEAGVAKQTLYRRWPSKAELVLDAFLESAARYDKHQYMGLIPSIEGFLIGLFRHLERDGVAIRNLIAAAQTDAHFRERFRAKFVAPRATQLRKILELAVDSCELSADTDLGALSDMIHGAFWYRLLTGETLDGKYAKLLAEQVGLLTRCG